MPAFSLGFPEGRPKVKSTKKMEHVDEGESVVLRCSAEAFPAVQYWRWYRENESGVQVRPGPATAVSSLGIATPIRDLYSELPCPLWTCPFWVGQITPPLPYMV